MPNYCLQTYTGHTSHLMSLDFHPKNNDLFCSCDANNEIHFWNINQYLCVRVSKGSSAQVRFQPRIGQFTDAECDRQTHSLQGTPQNCTLFVGIQMWLRSVKSLSECGH